MTTGSNSQLRAHREATVSPLRPGLPMSRAELAEAVNAHIWEAIGRRTCLDGDTIGRYERGLIRWPSADYRAALGAVLGAKNDGDLGFYPTRRGNTAVPSSRSKVDHDLASLGTEEQVDPVDRRNFLRTAGALGAAMVVGAPSPASGTITDRAEDLESVRRALLTHPVPGTPVDAAGLVARAASLQAAYQAARYRDVVLVLPGIITDAAGVGGSAAAQAARSHAMVVTAKLLTKVGNASLAHVAADRGFQAALQSGQAGLISAAAYQVSCAVLRLLGTDDARAVSESAYGAARADGPAEISGKGALALISAVSAARAGDAAEAKAWLRHASKLAEHLGQDANFAWTAFGPTNVLIHKVSVAVELGQPDQVIKVAANVDTDLMPAGLRSRRSQIHIDSAWAYTRKHRDPEAVISLLEAERHAAQNVQHSDTAQALVTEILSRRSQTPGLRALARRIGVAA